MQATLTDVTTGRVSTDTVRHNVAKLYRRAEARRRAVVEPVAQAEPISVDSYPMTVVERLHRRDSDGSLTRRGGRGTRDAGTVSAPGYMVALEDAHRARVEHLRAVEACMRSEPHNGGRGALAQRAASSVNGTEVRGATRWQASDKGKRFYVAANGRRVTLDLTCYRVLPDGSREPLVSSATARERKRAAAEPVKRVGAPLLASSLPRVEAD